MRCAIYARQSKTREGSESLETQVERCREAAERMGFDVVEVLVEPPSTSGYKNRGRSRAKFKLLLDGFRDGRFDMVMAYKTDRLSRGGGPGWSPLLEAIESAKLDLDRAVATPSGFVSEFEIGIRASMDREESKKLSERISDVAARKAAQGLPHGSRRPFGYLDNLVDLHEQEASVLREMATRVMSGHSYKEVCYWLNDSGIKTTEGKQWFTITVRNMLMKHRYAGIRLYKGTEYVGQWTPVFDRETWERLQLTIEIRGAAVADVPKSKRYLLTGLTYCGKCGVPLNGMTKRDKPERPLRRTYQCRTQGNGHKRFGCGGVTRNADALEDWIKDTLLDHLSTGSLLQVLGASSPDDLAIRQLLDQRKAQNERLDDLVDDYATGLLKKSQFDRAKQTAENELIRMDRDLARLTSRHTMFSLLPSGKSIKESWDTETDGWRRSLISSLIERIVLSPGITKPYYKQWRFDPTLVTIEWRDLSGR